MPKAPAAPVVTRHEVFIDGLDPRHDGVRIAHLSDIHVGRLTPEPHVRAAIELANAESPDLVALTGDYVCWRRHEVDLARTQLAGLRARRVLAVLGNHDYFAGGPAMRQALTDNGYEVMRNISTQVELGGAPLWVVGVDDPVTRHHDFAAAFAGVPNASPRVVLCHSPDVADELPARRADLTLSGHTHGGQMYVRGVTDRLLNKVGLHRRRGMYDLGGGNQLYVTPGVGFSGVTRRFGEGTRAEVALLTLRVRRPN
jgi:predicted MPP superfamily phosphohydrolase